MPPLSGAPDVCEALLHGGATNPLRCECDVLESNFFNWLLDSTQLQKQSMKSVYCKNDDTQHELWRIYVIWCTWFETFLCYSTKRSQPCNCDTGHYGPKCVVILRQRRLNEIALDKRTDKSCNQRPEGTEGSAIKKTFDKEAVLV